MKRIVTDRAEAAKAGLLATGRYFVKASTGEAMYIPLWYGHRLDLKEMTVTEDRAEIDRRTDLPDLSLLVKQGYILEAAIYREHDVNLGYIHGMSVVRLKNIIEEFREHGFAVTEEAILHNYKAWKRDLKSGFRDKENGYHLFSPCGCNPLSLRATSLEEGLD